jgi:hypothetical protein
VALVIQLQPIVLVEVVVVLAEQDKMDLPQELVDTVVLENKFLQHSKIHYRHQLQLVVV